MARVLLKMSLKPGIAGGAELVSAEQAAGRWH